MSLFRSEVFEHRKEKLHGNVHMALPMSWQIIGALIFSAIIIAIIFLSLASYSRIETVTGIITPTGGISQITSARTGVIKDIKIADGQSVEEGNALIEINADQRLADGGSSNNLILDSLSSQESGLQLQKRQVSAAMQAEQSQLAASIQGLNAEISGIKEQISVQEGLVVSAKEQLDQARVVAERGFISKRDILTREETYLSRQQQLSGLRQTLARQQSAAREAELSIRQARANAGAQISSLDSQKSDITQRMVNTQASSAYQLSAPIDGKVTALTARVGQAVTAGQPLMAIIPKGSKLIAELYVPSAATGFIEVGQSVGLALDAYPYQRFGTVKARIKSIASAPITQAGQNGATVAVFLVVAELDETSISAYGDNKPLSTGMSLTANIVTEEQSLIKWLFEPLFAVRNR